MSEQFLPLLILLLPFGLALAVYPLRRWKIGVWASVAVAVMMAAAAWWLLPERGFDLLGRSFVAEPFSAQLWSILWLVLAVLSLLSVEFSPGWTFFPAGTLMVGLAGWAMFSPHVGIAALFVEMNALVAVFAIQGGRLGSVRAAQRFLVMMTLAIPLFLLDAWYIDAIPGTPSAVPIAVLSAGGFALWLGIFPLHGWISALAREALPAVVALVLLVFSTVAMIWLLRLSDIAPWVREISFASVVLLWGGALSVGMGGLFAAAQNSFSGLMGYSVLFQLGVGVMALGLQNRQGITIVLLGIVVRSIALLMLAAAIAIVRQGLKRDTFEQSAGIAHRYPVALLGMMVGGATLAGAPLTVGFIPHWFLLKSTAAIDIRLPMIILLGSIGVSTGYLRGLWHALRPASPGTEFSGGGYWVSKAIIIAEIALITAIGVFPQPILMWLTEISSNLGLSLP